MSLDETQITHILDKKKSNTLKLPKSQKHSQISGGRTQFQLLHAEFNKLNEENEENKEALEKSLVYGKKILENKKKIKKKYKLLKENYKQKELELERIKVKIDDLKFEIHQNHLKFKSLSSDLEGEKETNENFRKKIKILEGARETLAKNNKVLRKEKRDLQNHLNGNEGKLDNMERKLDYLKIELKSKNEKILEIQENKKDNRIIMEKNEKLKQKVTQEVLKSEDLLFKNKKNENKMKKKELENRENLGKIKEEVQSIKKWINELSEISKDELKEFWGNFESNKEEIFKKIASVSNELVKEKNHYKELYEIGRNRTKDLEMEEISINSPLKNHDSQNQKSEPNPEDPQKYDNGCMDSLYSSCVIS